MLEKLYQDKTLYQEAVIYDIATKFGAEFIYLSVNEGLSIDRRILNEFRSLAENTVVWDSGEKCWRYRAE